MPYTNLSARVDEKDKRKFEEFCQKTGMNVSVAVNLFIKTVLRENRIPFNIEIDPFYSESNIQAINNSIVQLAQGQVVNKTMTELLGYEDEQN